MRTHPSHNQIASRLKSLRAECKNNNLHGFIVPHEDMFQSEYLLPRDEWIYYFSHFKGSAGVLIVLENEAALFVDGRYTLQVKKDVDDSLITLYPLGTEHEWLEARSKDFLELTRSPLVMGFNPWTITFHRHCLLQGNASSLSLLPVEDILESLWFDRPSHPCAALFTHPIEYSGKPSFEKIQHTRILMQKKGVDAFLLGPESWHWLLNLRGGDLDYTPLSQGFLWLDQKALRLFLFSKNVGQSISHKDIGREVVVDTMDNLSAFLRKTSLTFAKEKLCFGFDPSQTPFAAVNLFHEPKTLQDPSLVMRACKNSVEIKGAEKAHVKDAIAWMDFWCQLQQTIKESSLMPHQEGRPQYLLNSKGRPYTEYDVMTGIENTRKTINTFHSLSFPTIAGCGPNGAIVHYHASKDNARRLCMGELLLLDSGGQYKEGTTDITRTILLEPLDEDFDPNSSRKPWKKIWKNEFLDEIRHAYTSVLKGHIALSRSVFPKGTAGSHLDILARQYLWNHHMDFAHGTGHGVGSFLSVHEGPQRISKTGNHPLLKGMIVSNEPGYYKEDAFGIRIENLMYVKESVSLNAHTSEEWLSFQPLTLVPFDHRLICWELLDAHDMQWIESYYSLIWTQCMDYLNYDAPKTITPHPVLRAFFKKCLSLEGHITKH